MSEVFRRALAAIAAMALGLVVASSAEADISNEATVNAEGDAFEAQAPPVPPPDDDDDDDPPPSPQPPPPPPR